MVNTVAIKQQEALTNTKERLQFNLPLKSFFIQVLILKSSLQGLIRSR